MDNIQSAITVLSLLSVILVLLAWQFDRRIYIPFLQKMGIKHLKQPGFYPDLLGLVLVIAGCGMLFYAVFSCVRVAMG